MNISEDGIYKRDYYILNLLAEKNIPTSCVIGGGYDKNYQMLASRHSIIHYVAN